ncbi:unnamed protein product [Angiostrongylus costaricensis]|uniref:BPTI/Kunitz inhibitor domain-containing protein n=1 Tax=Angiostrongylus costaricensis TaxID=334426 RepID=A0A158PM74_ANGCS|nr:unnamed protein product [Angiostrongylus costaricensis]
MNSIDFYSNDKLNRSPTTTGTTLCSLPLAVGSCTAPSTRFYYDSSSTSCKRFTYSGCGGNANNFQSLASCQATCGSSGISFLTKPFFDFTSNRRYSFIRITGTSQCPVDASDGLNCFFAHIDACNSGSDFLGRENTATDYCIMWNIFVTGGLLPLPSLQIQQKHEGYVHKITSEQIFRLFRESDDVCDVVEDNIRRLMQEENIPAYTMEGDAFKMWRYEVGTAVDMLTSNVKIQKMVYSLHSFLGGYR